MILESYLSKHSFNPQYFKTPPADKLEIIVVIPVYNEVSLINTFKSLFNCDQPKGKVEIIVVFNASESSALSVIERNEKAKEELELWNSKQDSSFIKLFIIEENSLPAKHAGVGLARKIGMDEAVRRFQYVNYEGGVILCFDADSLCEKNYLIEIEKHFKGNPRISASSIHFEHPIEGVEFEESIYEGITNYELHLRYYKNGLSYAGLPFAFHTIGSSMAVRALDYCKEGGMNKRKAGEDFYFLQKFIQLDSFSEISSTKVIPSPRQSDRVPFGTGRAIKEMLNKEREKTKSYSFQTFEVLKFSFHEIELWYSKTPSFSKELIDFIGKDTLNEKLEEIRSQSTSSKRFKKRFFLWFNAFKTLKFVHFIRDYYYPLEEMNVTVPKLLNKLNVSTDGSRDSKVMLSVLRKYDSGSS